MLAMSDQARTYGVCTVEPADVRADFVEKGGLTLTGQALSRQQVAQGVFEVLVAELVTGFC